MKHNKHNYLPEMPLGGPIKMDSNMKKFCFKFENKWVQI